MLAILLIITSEFMLQVLLINLLVTVQYITCLEVLFDDPTRVNQTVKGF